MRRHNDIYVILVLEGIKGESFISLNAKLMKLYMEAYGVTAEDFAYFAITTHDNGCTNPNAFLQKKIDFDTYMNSPMLVDPVKLFDAPPVCDGAALSTQRAFAQAGVSKDEIDLFELHDAYTIFRVRRWH